MHVKIFTIFLRNECKIKDLDLDTINESHAVLYEENGNVYVRYLDIVILLSKSRGSGFAKPSTIAERVREEGLEGNRFVREVLGIKRFGEKVTKAAAAVELNVSEEIQNVDSGKPIQLDNFNESMERLNDTTQEETSFSYSPQTVLNLQRAHKSINTIDHQINIATAKIEANEKEIAGLKREREDRDTSEERRKEIDSVIQELEETNNVQREFINDLKPRLRNHLVSIRETLYKMLYQDKTLGEKLKTYFVSKELP